jgi:hypothetical protein
MAKRLVIGGLAVGVGALVLAPGARTWLRRRLGLEPEDRKWFEEEDVETAEHEGDEPLDTRESRFSLRARLAEEGHAPPAAAEAAVAEPEFPAFEEPAPRAPDFPAFADPAPVAPASEEPVAETAPAAEPVTEAPYLTEVPALADPIVDELAADEQVTEESPAAGEPAAEEPAVEEPAAAEPADDEPAADEPATPAPSPWPPAPTAFPQPAPEPAPEYISYESLPAVTPEADEPKGPGEDTNELEPIVPVDEAESPEEEEPPLTPPTVLRPPTSPPANRPFSGESPSFRSAIDAARERVHGAAREATPDEDEGTEPADERP